MTVREIKVTEDNWGRYNASDDRSQDAMSAMLDLNTALDEAMPYEADWGGRYAGWLDGLGIESNSDEGWWSRAAIDPDNLNTFLKSVTDDEYSDRIGAMIRRLAELKPVLRSFRSRFTRVSEMLAAFESAKG